MAAMMK